MKKILIILNLIICIFNTNAQHHDQKRDYQWIFGYGSPKLGNIFDFNTKPMKLLAYPKLPNADLSGYVAQMCDTSGKLVVFTNGCEILNREFKTMQSGGGLNPGTVTSQILCKKSGVRIPQGAIMLPVPENDSIIYLFHKIDDNQSGEWQTLQLYLSVINIKANKGLGEVLLKNYKIVKDTQITTELFAVRHGNGKDWWVVTPYWRKENNDNRFMTLLVTRDSIKGPYEQAIGTPAPLDEVFQGAFSADGTQFVRHLIYEGIYYYKFDRNTGKFSDHKFIPIKPKDPPNMLGGCSFSPSGRFIYVSNDTELYQIDTYEKDWLGTMQTVAYWDGFANSIFTSKFIFQALAPDCKIYILPQGTIPFLSVINYPDRKGVACKVSQHIPINSNVDRGWPNLPSFRLGKIGEPFSPCDSTINGYIVDTGEVLNIEKNTIAATYPNPATTDINLDLFGYINQYKKGIFNLYDTQGNLAASYPLLQNHDEYRFDISNLANGMYFWHLVLDDKVRQTGKVVVMKE